MSRLTKFFNTRLGSVLFLPFMLLVFLFAVGQIALPFVLYKLLAPYAGRVAAVGLAGGLTGAYIWLLQTRFSGSSAPDGGT